MTIVKLMPVLFTEELDIDKILHPSFTMPSHCRVERRIVFNLYKHLEANGWLVTSVYDGEEFTATTTYKEVMERVFNLDECSLRVTRADKAIPKDATTPVEYGIWLILGNGSNGMDLIADYTFSNGKHSDNFKDVMEAFDVEVLA